MPDELEKPGEAQLFPSSGPQAMDNEALALFVVDGLKKFSRLLPYVRELRDRFEALPRGNANIMGCRTWNEFCERNLDRTPSAVRKALAAGKKLPAPPRTLLSALDQALFASHKFGEGDRLLFSCSDNGSLLLTTALHYNSRGHGGSFERRLDAVVTRLSFRVTVQLRDPSGEALKEPLELEELSPTFRVVLNGKRLHDILENIDGDPRIVFHGPGDNKAAIYASPTGRLEVVYAYNPFTDLLRIVESMAEPTSQEKPAPESVTEEPAQEPAQEAEPTAEPVSEPVESAEASANDERKQRWRETTARVHDLIERVPDLPRVPQFYVRDDSVSVLFTELELTVEQLERIVEALQPTSTTPTVDGGEL
ncbi:MAG TPA: hypothetical protein VGT24_10070 [Candidatus Acidoferrales bacterium]|nr:hypothetical protein [Candidatus Acidoferrales bacterium]